MNRVKINKLDHFGRGITCIDDKICFVNNALPTEEVDVEIVKSNKSYSEAIVNNYIKVSNKRIKARCPYFMKCGGCNLLYYKYSDTINYKIEKIKELLNKYKINYNKEIEVIKNTHDYNYRNKVKLKIENGLIGYYEDKTHKLVAITECIVANEAINKVIKNYKLLNIDNGELIIRSNLNNEILLIINTSNKSYNIELDKLKRVVKLVGIVINNKTIYGDNFLYERIGGYLFKISYDAFFQVNPFICKELFKLLDKYINSNSKVLDLYSGVGTLSIVASSKAKEVISVEIIKNAVIDGVFNAKINKKHNIKFMLGDVSSVINKINFDFDILIIDPPRKGLDKKTIEFINKSKPKEIIYISCDANTLMRDLKELNYEIVEYKILDMFSYSYHVESFLYLRKL